VDKLTIHYEPVEKDFLIYTIPVEEDKNILSDHFGSAPYFYLLRIDPRSISSKRRGLYRNRYEEEKAKGIKVVNGSCGTELISYMPNGL